MLENSGCSSPVAGRIGIHNKKAETLMASNKKQAMPQRGRRLGKDAWVLAARDALIDGGIEAVKIDRIAKSMEATRAAFYWHFSDRDELLNDLLAHWKVTSSRAYEEIVENELADGQAELEAINNMWLEEKSYDPAYDGAMREWARISKPVARVVRQVDQRRIDILTRIFVDLDYPEDEAFIRARVAYFHQIGYLALGLNESRKTRHELAPIYLKVLLGR